MFKSLRCFNLKPSFSSCFLTFPQCGKSVEFRIEKPY